MASAACSKAPEIGTFPLIILAAAAVLSENPRSRKYPLIRGILRVMRAAKKSFFPRLCQNDRIIQTKNSAIPTANQIKKSHNSSRFPTTRLNCSSFSGSSSDGGLLRNQPIIFPRPQNIPCTIVKISNPSQAIVPIIARRFLRLLVMF